jgi:hypothetical protein
VLCVVKRKPRAGKRGNKKRKKRDGSQSEKEKEKKKKYISKSNR